MRRPRAAFIAGTFPPRLYRINREHRARCARVPPRCSAAPSDRASEVRTRLESSRTRVRQLHSRAIVRAGAAGISLGAGLLRDAPPEQDSADAVFVQLRRDLRALRRAADDLPGDDPAVGVVARLAEIVDAVEKRVAFVRSGAVEVTQIDTTSGFVHDEIEEQFEGLGGVDEDMPWAAIGDGGATATTVMDTEGEDEPQLELVEVVKRKVAATGDQLKRKASSMGAGIEGKVAEFIKDDGSIDVDGLRSLVGGLLDTAGMTWKRLNGRVPKSMDPTAANNATEVAYSSLSVRDPEKEFELREEIGKLEKKLTASSKEREAVLRREDQLGKLIRAKEIRQLDDGVSALRRTLAVRVLQLEMEKIFVSVADEIENSDYQTMMEQRVLVAEFGDLDERLATLEVFIDQAEPLLIEDDAVGELASDILDLKTRLGLDQALYSSATLSWPQVQQFVASTVKTSREGADFYWRGLRLFAGDARFAMRLIRRTIVGYTPSPREIRTLRRTGRDFLSLIPFTIVLIAPLTPVGHVLIFSFLQRYWPEFFPSTFSERRQAVMKRHEAYAASLREDADANGEDAVDDMVDGDGGGKKEKRGLLVGLRRAMSFGVSAVEAKEEKVGEKGEVEISGESENGVGASGGVGKDESESEGEGHEEHPVELSRLAEGARDSEKMARKRRSASALDELHLAD